MAMKLVTRSVTTVTTGGTAVQVSTTSNWVHSISIQADPANSGTLYVGDSTVNATNGQAVGAGEVYVINAFDKPFNLEDIDLADIYINASANSQIARVAVIEKKANA